MIIRWLYNLLFFVAAPFFIYSLYKTKPNKPAFHERWKEHFGFTPALPPHNPPPIWIHAVSVGEVIAVTPLIKAFKQKHPEQTIVLTTTTSTGASAAQKIAELVNHRYMPLDFPFAVRAFIHAIKPRALFIMETELWPNTLHQCCVSDIPVTIINARLSERSAQRYAQFPFIFSLLMNNIQHVLAQTEGDAQRFIQLGLKPTQVTVTGSIKLDISVSQSQHQAISALRSMLGLHREVWIAASTHRGEDEQIIETHKQLLTHKPEALLILVPRHPERFAAVKALVESNDMTVITRTSQQPVTLQTQVYLGDSMGEMMILLGAADVCFMAGSLIGNKVGGHNLIEAAALGKPILNGPSYYNFKAITEQLVALGGCHICQNSHDISHELTRLFNHLNIRQQQGEIALKYVQENQGALQKTAQIMQSMMFDKQS